MRIITIAPVLIGIVAGVSARDANAIAVTACGLDGVGGATISSCNTISFIDSVGGSSVTVNNAPGVAPGALLGAESVASANLATGQLKATAGGSAAVLGNNNFVSSVSTVAIASFSDTIFFDDSFQNPFELNLRLSVDGRLLGSTANGSGELVTAFLRANSGGGGASVQAIGDYTSTGNVSFRTGTVNGDASATFLNDEANDLRFFLETTVLAVPNGSVTIDASLAAFGRIFEPGAIVSDFGNTGSLSIELPTGVNFTSDSGVFLTEQVAAVPLPATLPFIGVVIALFAGMSFRRRHS